MSNKLKGEYLNIKKDALISVIVPVFNTEDYIDRCIKSIVEQTYDYLEIILVDDGSSDMSPQICDRWGEKDSRIRVIHQENKGVSSARNIGIDNSNGIFIFFVDSDDIIHPQSIELLYKCQQQYHSDYVCSRRLYSYSEEWYSDRKEYKNIISKQISLNSFLAEKSEKGFVTGHLIRRSIIGDIRFTSDILLGEDVIFNLNLIQNPNINFSILEMAIYCYCYREASAAAQKRGFEGYYYTADWCNRNIYKYDEKNRGYIIKEALKKCFLYRFEFRKDRGGMYRKENRNLIKELMVKCKKESTISLKEKLVYTIMALIPFSYNMYVYIINRK